MGSEKVGRPEEYTEERTITRMYRGKESECVSRRQSVSNVLSSSGGLEVRAAPALNQMRIRRADVASRAWRAQRYLACLDVDGWQRLVQASPIPLWTEYNCKRAGRTGQRTEHIIMSDFNA